MMEWLRWHLEGNVLAIMLGVLIAAGIVAMAIFGTPFHRTNDGGLGPDWECTSHEWGGPTCIKKVKP